MKLIAIDMDGTLFNSEHIITEANLQALKDAQAAGHIVMLCSGRPHDALMEFMKAEYDLEFPVAGSNGAISYVGDNQIHSASMDLNTSAQLFEYLESKKHPFKLYTNQGAFNIDGFMERTKADFHSLPEEVTKHHNIKKYTEYLASIGSQSFSKFEELREREGLEIFKFFVSTLIPSKKAEIESHLKTLQGPMNFTSSAVYNIEIMSDSGHKGTGLREMAKHFGIPMENTVAIGDNFNDVPMLEVAGLSVAMGNAEPEVKALCDVVTRGNDEDGVAFAIREFVLKEKKA